MLKTERAALVQHRLDQWYPETPIPLDHCDPFTLLVAVLLSAQCTDKKVNEVTPALFRAAGTAKKMSNFGEDKILEIIRPLGLSKQKAKHLDKLSKILLSDFDSKVPQSFEHLESLPGVGHKTASVVMSQAFGVPAFPVDTHIHRLAQRWGLTNGKGVVQTEGDLKKLFPKTLGIVCICKLYFTAASTVPREVVTVPNVIFVASFIRIEKNRSSGRDPSIPCRLGFRVAKLVKSFGMWRFAESLDDFRYWPTRKLSCGRLLVSGPWSTSEFRGEFRWHKISVDEGLVETT